MRKPIAATIIALSFAVVAAPAFADPMGATVVVKDGHHHDHGPRHIIIMKRHHEHRKVMIIKKHDEN